MGRSFSELIVKQKELVTYLQDAAHTDANAHALAEAARGLRDLTTAAAIVKDKQL